MERAALKKKARAALKRNYWRAVLVSFVVGLFLPSSGRTSGAGTAAGGTDKINEMMMGYSGRELILILSAILAAVAVVAGIAVLFRIFLGNPFEVGAARFFLRCRDEEKAPAGEMMFAFSHNYLNIVKVMFLRDLYVLLWSLLLVVPGIIKSYRWILVPYILAENPEISEKDARDLSDRLMGDHKTERWFLDWTFFGWMLLSAMTFGILDVFYVEPYRNLTHAEFYCARKMEASGLLEAPPEAGGRDTYGTDPERTPSFAETERDRERSEGENRDL